MTRRTAMQMLLASRVAFGQVEPEDYVCPMDPDVRSSQPGTCPRCGMKLVLGIPDQIEYPMDLTVKPSSFHAGDPVQLAFRISDPRTGKQVKQFQIVHEKLFHMFIVSQDLNYFVHDHPVYGTDGIFRFDTRFPHSGLFRVLGDFYPAGGIPQLITRTVIVPGRAGEEVALAPAHLMPALAPNHCANMDVELVMEPEQPIAGMKTLMFFKLNPAEGLQPYLGAWAHMLAASDDTIDMIHNHPFIADGGPRMQFNLIFPRARMYRVWVQFQRKGVVNTAAFNVPVSELK
ncbi:MAG: heavy metal-binding domain-containing protein [Bryobacteraceae bacterium]